MSEAPDSTRPAARTRTAAYFIFYYPLDRFDFRDGVAPRRGPSIHPAVCLDAVLGNYLSSLVKNVPMLTSLRMSPFCVFLWSRCRPTGGRSGLQLQRLGFPFKERFET